MKLCVTFLLLLVILPMVTGEKSSERTLSGAKGDRGTCSYLGGICEHHFNCCGDLCCYGHKCVMTVLPCDIFRF
nr:conotoxin precursor I1 [Conus judaeus]UMA83731.1 conotoxin precursor I1 [Conus judaeus]DAZ86411.1 TPA_inf: conotoxin precursor I1 [Conus judaeus]